MTYPTREMILKAQDITGIVRRYGTEELSSINVLIDEDTVFSYDCGNQVWHPWNSDSYWDLYESEIMLTVMRHLLPEKALEILKEKNAFMSSVN